MHQTFYIDADEEISSVIDRLNKSVSPENYFVVPKRAIFLQSIVNLKLLKREADKLGKHLVIVTQDEIGASMAKRSGLEVKHTIEGLESKEIEDVFHADEKGQELNFFDSEIVINEGLSRKNRLNAVGSSDFFDVVESSKGKNHKTQNVIKSQVKKVSINGVSSAEKEVKYSGKNVEHRQMNGLLKGGLETHKYPGSLRNGKIDPSKEKVLEKMFSSANISKKNLTQKPLGVSTLTKKILMGFIVLCFVAFAGVATYLFLPSAKIIITPNITTEKSDLVVYVNSENSQVAENNIPIRVIDKEDKLSLSYDVVGGGGGGGVGAGKKAHGKVVIYNEYDGSAQTLIATTRLESSDGKIFRLAKNVVVPGMITVGSEVKPGAIEAEVVADQAGSEFNMAPTSFTVPGFKGGPKYAKFSAKSTESFVGGSSEGASMQTAVTQKDIDNAKQKTETALKEKIRQVIKDELKSDEILLDQNEKISIIKTGTNAKVGDLANMFNYDVSISIRALVFSEDNIKAVIEDSVSDNQNLRGSTWDISKIEYGTSVADFDKNTLELKVHSEISITPNIDIEKIKGELLGKKDDQLSVVLKNYSSIKTVNIEFQPTIVSRIPQYASRVSIELKKEN